MQERSNSIANTLELHLSCSNPSICLCYISVDFSKSTYMCMNLSIHIYKHNSRTNMCVSCEYIDIYKRDQISDWNVNKKYCNQKSLSSTLEIGVSHTLTTYTDRLIISSIARENRYPWCVPFRWCSHHKSFSHSSHTFPDNFFSHYFVHTP